ncbi:hypothetical protein CKY51_03360 [Xanthomonas maliensis]|nr:hypothetical protein CKY51_03360 [Xanthomonas maliensis]
MRFLVHGDLRLLGRNCPAPPPSRRSASCQGSQTAAGRKRAHRHAQPLTARTPWYVRGNGNAATPVSNEARTTGKRSAQARPTRPRRRHQPSVQRGSDRSETRRRVDALRARQRDRPCFLDGNLPVYERKPSEVVAPALPSYPSRIGIYTTWLYKA